MGRSMLGLLLIVLLVGIGTSFLSSMGHSRRNGLQYLLGHSEGTQDSGVIGGNSQQIEKKMSIKDEIFATINLLLDAKDSSKLKMRILMENAHILTTGNLYEEAIDELLNFCESEEGVLRLEKFDSMIRSFVQSERKSRCRLKVNYLVAGASSNRLEQAIEMLSNADEIDDNLLRFISGLIQKKLGETGLTSDNIENKLDGPGEAVVDVLKLIYDRLKAEIQVRGNCNLKLLARLVHEDPTDSNFKTIIKKTLTTVEEIESFATFLEHGVDHLTEMLQKETSASRDMDVLTLQRMRNIRKSLSSLLMQLKTGLTDEDNLFSTYPDDYASSSES